MPPAGRPLPFAFQIGETAFVDFGDAGESSDVFAVLLGSGLQFLNGRCERAKSLVVLPVVVQVDFR